MQLIPYLDTPNNGGVYKVWVTPLADYLCRLTVVDCGYTAGHNVHGFVPSNSKTDNFKVQQQSVREIDTRFHDTNNNGALIDGMGITHVDPLGASDVKWSYYNQALDVNHEAHVEAVESSTHLITINNQPGCTVDDVYVAGVSTGVWGPQTVSVKISPNNQAVSVIIDVNCN